EDHEDQREYDHESDESFPHPDGPPRHGLQPRGSKNNIQPTSADAHVSSSGGFGALEAEAKVCGVHLLQRGANLWVASEICGAKWHALGMQKESATVYVRHGASAPYDQSSPATVSFDAGVVNLH